MISKIFNLLQKVKRNSKTFTFTVSKERAMELAEKKICALADGLHTDCSFLVGSDDSSSQLLHAFKCDLKLASEVFDAMLRSPLTDLEYPIRIKHHEGRIFAILLQYVHVHFLQEDSIETLEDLIALSLAADEFLVEPLVKLCSTMAKKMLNPENVWVVLNALNHRPEFAAKCVEILARETMRCLKHPTFLAATSKSLSILLQLNRLNVNSELDLLNACIKWSSSSPTNHIRSVLPHLRLLNLHLDEISFVSKYLNGKEKAALAHAIVFKDKSMMPKSLSLNSNLRLPFKHCPTLAKTEGIIEIIPKELLTIDTKNPLKYELSAEISQYRQRNIISFKAGKNMFVSSTKILSRLNEHSNSLLLEYQEYLQISIERMLPGAKKSLVYSEHIREPSTPDQTFEYSFKEPVYLPEGTDFLLYVVFGPGLIHKNFFAKGAFSASMPRNRNLKCREGEEVAIRGLCVKHEYFIEGNKNVWMGASGRRWH